MGAHTKSMSWYMGQPNSPAPGSAGEAQQALLFALGLNSLARCLIRWARRSSAAAGGEAEAGGLKKRALRSIPIEVYGACGAAGAAADVCAICLGEFADGEKVRVLPRCGHGFHVRCVDTWLVSHDSCPTCRGSVLNGATGAKAAPAPGSSRRSGSEAAAVTVVIS